MTFSVDVIGAVKHECNKTDGEKYMNCEKNPVVFSSPSEWTFYSWLCMRGYTLWQYGNAMGHKCSTDENV